MIIDINPSVEFVVNNQDKVTNVIALNEDAEIVLSGLDSLIGLDTVTATEAYIAEATLLGFVDVEADSEDPNAVLITVLSDNENAQNRLRNRVQEGVSNYMKNNGIWGVCFNDGDMVEIAVEAQELGISTGKLRMIKAILISGLTEYTQEELIEMTNRQLVEIMKGENATNYKDGKETEHEALKTANQSKINAHEQNQNQKRTAVQNGWDEFVDDQKGENGSITRTRFNDLFLD